MNRMILTPALLTLAACGGAAPNQATNAEAEAPPANTAAPVLDNAVAAPAAMPADGVVTPAFMAGKWSAIDEKCDATVELKPDGTVMTPVGPGKWTLAGDKLTFDYGDGSKQEPSTVKILAADRIEITRGGRKETQRRC